MVPKTFISPKFEGKRFNEHVLPIDVLRELEAYQALVADVARLLYLDEHPGRERVPKGFAGALRLGILKIDDGCIQPEIVRLDSAPPLFEGSDYHSVARDLISEVISEVAAGRPVPRKFPQAAIRKFNGLGLRLRKDESLDVRSPGSAKAARYTPALRKQIILSHETEYEANVCFLGRVIALRDKDDGNLLTFESGASSFQCPLSDARRAFVTKLYLQKHLVWLRGVGYLDRNENAKRMTKVFDMTPLSDLLDGASEHDKRLTDLGPLAAGWLDGIGEPIEVSFIEQVRTLLGQLAAAGVPSPLIFPTAEGAIQAEWACAPWEIKIEFQPHGGTARLLALSTESDDDIEREGVSASAETVISFLGETLAMVKGASDDDDDTASADLT
ncbi:MAG: hypothetical protein U0174_23155 [Polyangiaceae bacterium]